MNNNNIIDIPEIAQVVASYLAPADLFIACRVSRSWFIPFASELWRSIKPDQWTHGALEDALPRYSLYIRELHCPLYNSLDKLGLDCTKLTLFRAPLLNANNAQVITSILRRNPNIEELSLISGLTREQLDISMEYVRIVSEMKKLKNLSLHHFIVRPGSLENLLQRLPQLESLSIRRYNSYQLPVSDATKEFDRSMGSSIDLNQLPQHSEYQGPRQLRYFHVDGYQDSFESILKVARISPLMERLSLAETYEYSIDLSLSPAVIQFCQELSSLCHCLDQLTLYQIQIDPQGLMCLLAAFPKLKRLDLEDVSLQAYDILRAVLQSPSYSHTLEEIRFVDHPTYFRQPTSHEILVMLRTFSKLRKVVLENCIIKAEEMVSNLGDNEIEDTESHNSDLSEEEESALGEFGKYGFRSRELEVLKVTIVGPTSRWAPPLNFAWDHTFNLDDDDGEEDEGEWAGYKLYFLVMDQLTSLPNLNLKGVRFSY
ncbi:hypothetical protein BGZ79_006818 [Entomortierella chlamydospora]|nr:hypothetical protein BGZ79_006818 [Entomortierella chlamydospora]